MKQQARDSFALAVGSMMPVLIATQPAQAQTSAITGIEIIETLTGAEVFLQTTTAQLLEISTTQSDNTLITEVTNAQLRLPEGQPLQSTSFSNTIESVEVLQATENSVQIQITGMDALPEISTDLTIDGLFLRAQGSESNWVTDDGTETLELVVTATRTPEDPEDISRSVTIITRDQIATQAALNQNLGDILGQLVPGFGPTSDRAFTAASLRGRTASILVDGVPLNVNNRDFDRELKTIAPNAIERIEVVRGPSALYGGEATGGIINIITRRAGEERLVTQVELGVDAALGNFEGESFGNFLRYGLSGQENNVDYLVDLSRTSSGAIFDAEGDRIPVIQGNDESETFNILGKVGIALGEQQRLQFSANHYNSKRTTDVISDPIVDAIPGVQKAQALEVGELQFPAGGGPQTDRNTVFNVSYNHADLWVSNVSAQVYYRDNLSRTDPRDRRPRPFGIFQGELNSENWGGRLGVQTPLTPKLSLLWGADYDQETTSNTFNLFDPNAFDASNGQVNVLTEQRALVPPFDLNSLGLFTQVQWEATERLQLVGGIRYEKIDLAVGDYTTFFGDFIEGGRKDFDTVLFNAGLVYDASDHINLFANFAQGFSVPDFGLVLGFPDPGFSVASDVTVNQPQKVDEFELGIRGNWRNIQASIAGFYNQSDLGSTFEFNPSTGFFDILRAPERVYGIEATVDAQLNDTWNLGGTISWSEGEADLEDNGTYLPLSSARIQPLKLTAYVENETLPGWTNRLQALYVGSRDRAFQEDIDPREIDSYFLVDWLSSVKLGQGTLQIGVKNLFDTLYFPAYAQRSAGFSDTFNSAGSGRTLSLRYSLTF